MKQDVANLIVAIDYQRPQGTERGGRRHRCGCACHLGQRHAQLEMKRAALSENTIHCQIATQPS